MAPARLSSFRRPHPPVPTTLCICSTETDAGHTLITGRGIKPLSRKKLRQLMRHNHKDLTSAQLTRYKHRIGLSRFKRSNPLDKLTPEQREAFRQAALKAGRSIPGEELGLINAIRRFLGSAAAVRR